MPPTLVATIYGMNFNHIPELEWPFGYPLALGLMVFSAWCFPTSSSSAKAGSKLCAHERPRDTGCRAESERPYVQTKLAMPQDGSQKIRFCTSRDGVRFGFATCGTGPTLVAAAHWISHLRLDWDNPVRRAWLSMLSRRHTAHPLRARGTGLSDRDCADFSLQRQIEDLEAVVEAAKCDRFALLGLWTGGAVAIKYAVRHPGRATHLVLHACATRGRLVRDPAPDQVEEAEAQLKLIELGWGNENSAFRQLHTSQLMPDATTEQAARSTI